MAKLSSRQIYIFLACLMPLGKLITMPSQIVASAKNDLLFSAAINVALSALGIFFVLLIAKKNQSFYDLLVHTFGKIVAKIFIVILALFLFFAAFLPLLEQKLLVQSVFYDTLPPLVAFAPFFVFSAYLCAMPLSSFGRIFDLLAPLVVVAFLGIMIFSVGSADYGALLPIGASGIEGIAKGATGSISWFYDSAVLLVLLGKFEYRKGMAWKGTVWYLVGSVALLFTLATFYGIFSDIALRQTFAISKISKYFAAITALGRIDYLFIFTLALAMIFSVSLPLVAGVDCLNRAFGYGKIRTSLFACGINLTMLLFSHFLNFSFPSVNQGINTYAFWVVPLFCIVLPALSLLLRRPHEKKTD